MSKVSLTLIVTTAKDECSLEPECAFHFADTRGHSNCTLFGLLREKKYKAPAGNVHKIRPLRDKNCLEMEEPQSAS